MWHHLALGLLKDIEHDYFKISPELLFNAEQLEMIDKRLAADDFEMCLKKCMITEQTRKTGVRVYWVRVGKVPYLAVSREMDKKKEQRMQDHIHIIVQNQDDAKVKRAKRALKL
eukprot:COSAG01_NODE_40556_length_462_cov_0.862259_1_plen_113_part_10